jgi:mannitol/fructose-specific phosphotransferase system IIA component (Ntr-type)
MITIQDVLSARHVALEIEANTPAAAIHEIASLLKGDERVTDWNRFYDALHDGNSCVASETGLGMCIPHARTSSVSSMVMAVGRSVEGIAFASRNVTVHTIFVIGVPEAMASDYLRIIGALARIVKSPEGAAALREATTRLEFLEALIAGEMAAD